MAPLVEPLAPGSLLRSVGHFTHPGGLTGCTVVVCEAGAVASGEVRGAAPGTRETDLLRPGGLVQRVHAVLLAGGSAFGLAAADGVMQWLRSRGVGHAIGHGIPPVPIVPGAVIFDLGARAGVFPDSEAGRLACEASLTPDTRASGRIGAGAGATVGKAGGAARASPGGIGRAALQSRGVAVEALMVANPFGEIRDPGSGGILSGVRGDAGFVPTLDLLLDEEATQPAPFNTVIGVVATSAALDQAGLSVVARMANAGLGRVVYPAHTMYDGDTLFALSLPAYEGAPLRASAARITLAGSLAAEAVALALQVAVSAG